MYNNSLITTMDTEKSPVLSYTDETVASYLPIYNNNAQQHSDSGTTGYCTETEASIYNNIAQQQQQTCPSYSSIDWTEDCQISSNSQLPYHSAAANNIGQVVKEQVYSNCDFYPRADYSNLVTSPDITPSPPENQQT